MNTLSALQGINESVAALNSHASATSKTQEQGQGNINVNMADDAGNNTVKKGGQGRTSSKKCISFPVEPRVLQAFKKSRSHVNHSYRDFSNVPANLNDTPMPSLIDDMTFNQKVHHILSCEEYSKFISWLPHGRAFKVRK
jgi:hypothetical protein